MTERAAGARLFTIPEILSAAGGELHGRSAAVQWVSSVAVDSRLVAEGGLFVALRGERVDGHAFAGQAAERGARALLVSRAMADRIADSLGSAREAVSVIAVDDPLTGLQELARFHMRRLPGVTRIGVTGSNGKTTTKEIIGAILGRASPTAVNEGNLNSEIGLPLACFGVGTHRYGVFEMGMNRRGEMDILADIVRPDVALVTNVGSAHIGLLGSKQLIAKEKKSIFSRFTGREAAFLNEEEPFRGYLADGVKGRIVLFGPKSTHGFEGSESLGLDGTLINWEGSRIRFPLFGAHNLANALGAVSVARELGIGAGEIRDGLQAVKPLFGRSEIIHGPVTVVFDGYNANPDSMERAISFLEHLPWKGRKVAALGGMRELGEGSAQAHAALGRRLASAALDAVLLFGEEMGDAWHSLTGTAAGERAFWSADFPALAERARALLRPGDILLIKGSRGLEMERLLPHVTAGRAQEARCS